VTPWALLGRRSVVVRRTRDWTESLGSAYPEWACHLAFVADPIGVTFAADFGSGEAEYELSLDDEGHWAVPTDGLTPVRLNATEAEFQRLDMVAVLRRIATASRCGGDCAPLGGHLFRLGHRNVGSKAICVVAAPGGYTRNVVSDASTQSALLSADAMLLAVPDVSAVAPTDCVDLLARRIVVVGLPSAGPWKIDWMPVVERLNLPVDEPGQLFGDDLVVLVDARQERVWIRGAEVLLKAGSQQYRLIAHLAERPGLFVPYAGIANGLLADASGDRTESKVFADVKDAFTKAVARAWAGSGVQADAKQLLETTGGRVRLAVLAAQVRVIRTLSEG